MLRRGTSIRSPWVSHRAILLRPGGSLPLKTFLSYRQLRTARGVGLAVPPTLSRTGQRRSIAEGVGGRGGLEVNDDGFKLGEVMQGFEAVLAPHARELVAAIRQHPVRRAEGVDGDEPGFELGSDAMGAPDIRGPEAGDEAVIHLVGEADDLLFAVERHCREHGAEDLFLREARIVVDVGKDGGFDVIAAVEAFRAAAPGNEACAFRLAESNISIRLRELLGRGLRPDMGLLVEGRAHADAARAGGDLIDELLVERAFDKEARAER